MYEVVYTHPDGTERVRYARHDADRALRDEVDRRRAWHAEHPAAGPCPYSVRDVPDGSLTEEPAKELACSIA